MNDQVKSIDHVISNGTKMVSSSNYFAMEEVREGGNRDATGMPYEGTSETTYY